MSDQENSSTHLISPEAAGKGVMNLSLSRSECESPGSVLGGTPQGREAALSQMFMSHTFHGHAAGSRNP